MKVFYHLAIFRVFYHLAIVRVFYHLAIVRVFYHLAIVCGLAFRVTGAEVRADIQPKLPVVATGNDLTLNCTLLGGRGRLKPDGLFFILNNSINRAYVLNERTIVLRLENVQRNMTGVVECRHHSPDVRNDSTKLIVADKPRKPRVECRVFNWVNMSCIWEPQNDNGIPTVISLEYSRHIIFDPHQFYRCPHQEKNSCSWRQNDGQDSYMNVNHWIIIVAENRVGQDYDAFSINPAESVQPGSVVNLTCHTSSSQSAFLSWLSPHSGKSLMYRIIYTHEWNENRSTFLNETSMNMSDLIPHTNYKFTVDCIPMVNNVQKGYWSAPKVCQFITPTDVPAMTPLVTPGGFRLLKTEGKYRQVQIYWQRIPEHRANGRIVGHRVKIYKNRFSNERLCRAVVSSEAEQVEEVLLIDGSATNATITRNEEVDYCVTVEAKTSAGFNESLVPQQLVIPKSSNAPGFPERLVASTDSEFAHWFHFNWSSVSSATGYTIHWCSSFSNRPDICVTSYSWERMNSSRTEHRIYLRGQSCQRLGFYISVETVLTSGEEVSSGLKPIGFICSRDGELKLPEKLNCDGSEELESLVVRWEVPSDNNYCRRSACISQFVVEYCSATCYEKVVDWSADSTIQSAGLTKHSTKLTGLSPGTTYRIRIKSRSFDRESSFSESIEVTTQSTILPVSHWQIPIITVSAAVSSVLLILVLCVCCWSAHKRDIDIVVPKKCELSMFGTPHDGYRFILAQHNLSDDSFTSFNTTAASQTVDSRNNLHEICPPWQNFPENISQAVSSNKTGTLSTYSSSTEYAFVHGCYSPMMLNSGSEISRASEKPSTLENPSSLDDLDSVESLNLHTYNIVACKESSI